MKETSTEEAKQKELKQHLWEWEKINNPFFPNGMRFDREHLTSFAEFHLSQLAKKEEPKGVDKAQIINFALEAVTSYDDTGENEKWYKSKCGSELLTIDELFTECFPHPQVSNQQLPTDEEILNKAINDCKEIAGSVNGFRYGAKWVRDNFKLQWKQKKEGYKYIIIEAKIYESGTIEHGIATDFNLLETLGLVQMSITRLSEQACEEDTEFKNSKDINQADK